MSNFMKINPLVMKYNDCMTEAGKYHTTYTNKKCLCDAMSNWLSKMFLSRDLHDKCRATLIKVRLPKLK